MCSTCDTVAHMDYLSLPLPAEIDGEPDQVVELSGQGLAQLAAAAAAYVAQDYVQRRAAGLLDYPTLADWEDSPEGQAAIEVKNRATALVQSVRRLLH